MAEQAMLTIMDQDIPEAQQNLRDSHANLEKVSHYCKVNYIQADDKRVALEETKNYAIQALASVAYQVNAFSYHLMQLFEHEEMQLAEMESHVRHVNETVMVHKEKIARREIGALATTNKPMQRQHKFLPPPTPERAIRYMRKPIDYNVFDDIGHGLKINQPSNPRSNTRKNAPASIGDSSSISSGPSTTYDIGAMYRKTGSLNPSLNLSLTGTGTLSRNQARNLSDYRTPVPVPPPPPVVPPTAAVSRAGDGGLYGASATGIKQQHNTSSPHLNSRQEYYPFTGHTNSSIPHGNYVGIHVPPGAAQQALPLSQHSPLPSSAHFQYASQKQIFQHSAAQSPRKLSSSSTENGYGALSAATGNGNGNGGHNGGIYQPNQQAHRLQSHSNHTGVPLPPPAPSMDGHYAIQGRGAYLASTTAGGEGGRGSVRSSSGVPSRSSLNNDMINTPPIPPPPPEPTIMTATRNGHNFDNGAPEWAPKVFLEKVVAIYDYQADKDDELSFLENQIIYVIKKNDDGWYEGVMDGVRGLFPGNYVEPAV